MMACLVQVAGAEPVKPLTAEIMSATGHGGETVEVSVYMEPGLLENYDDYFWQYALDVKYDPSVLKLEEVKDEADSKTFTANEGTSGSITVNAENFGDFGFIDSHTKMFTVSFLINKDAVSGDTAVTLESGTYTYEEVPIAIPELIRGKVAVVNDAPAASDVSISGSAAVGATLTGSYTYADSENNTEGASVVQWYAASNAEGTDKALIAGATTKALELTDVQLVGKYIFFEVTPAASGGTLTGSAVLSAGTGPVMGVTHTAEVKIGDVSGVRNTKVEVPVILKEASTGVGSYGIRIAFDPDALQVDAITGPTGEMFSSNYSNETGWLQAGWADASGGDHSLAAGETLFKVTFHIQTKAAEGKHSLTIADTADLFHFTLTDANAIEMDKALTEGSVSVYTPASNNPTPDRELITVDIQEAGSSKSGVVSKAQIERIKNADGTKSDKVTMSAEQAKQTVDSIAVSGSKQANIIIPDTKDEVSDVRVTVPKASSKLIGDAKINLGIATDNVEVIIPNESLQGLEEDFYFHFIPIKSEAGKQAVKERANMDVLIKTAAGEKGATIVGRPMTIETNLQNRPVTLIMPLGDVQLSEAELAGLSIYVEHSDGTKELLKGELVSYGSQEDMLGLKFSVTKFSTFTLVLMEGKPQQHNAYIKGYADGTFRPEHNVTRAEIAAMLSRIVAADDRATSGKTAEYSDVPAGNWASKAIADVTAWKLMRGYTDGTFAPERNITRAEMAVIVSKLVDEEAAGAGFTDINSLWAEKAILKAQGAGIVSGYADGSFRPNEPLTRAEAVVILNKIFGRTGQAGSNEALLWQDVPATYWAYRDIMEASVEHAYTSNADNSESWK
jgi:hypothetical protein